MSHHFVVFIFLVRLLKLHRQFTDLSFVLSSLEFLRVKFSVIELENIYKALQLLVQVELVVVVQAFEFGFWRRVILFEILNNVQRVLVALQVLDLRRSVFPAKVPGIRLHVGGVERGVLDYVLQVISVLP